MARMRRAGAILLGKTNVPPGGSGGVTDNLVDGRTRNPFDRERSVAGSSGGEAAIQAAGGSPIGLGSDSGGSLRVPAHYCGIATLKPTTGRVPNTGAFGHEGGLSDSRTQIGPLSRFVEDLAPTLSLLAGPDGRDSGVVPVPLGDPAAVPLDGLRVAFYTDDGETATTPDTAAAVRDAAEALRQSGARVTERCPANVGRDALDITWRYWGWDDLEGGKSVQLLSDWDRFRSDMLTFMESVDLILCPTAPAPAPLHGEGPDTMFNYTLPYSLTGQPCVGRALRPFAGRTADRHPDRRPGMAGRPGTRRRAEDRNHDRRMAPANRHLAVGRGALGSRPALRGCRVVSTGDELVNHESTSTPARDVSRGLSSRMRPRRGGTPRSASAHTGQLVADLPHRVQILPGGIVEVPVLVPLARVTSFVERPNDLLISSYL